MSTTSIYDLEISGRTKLALLRLGIRTLEDLRAVPIAELEQQKHIGLFVLSEIKRVLSENGMPVGSTDMVESEKKKSYSTEQIEEMKQHSVTELELSSRALRALFSANYETVDKIVTLKTNDFRDLKGLGSKAVEEIIAKRDKWLKDNGFIEIDRQKELAISETMEQLMKYLSTVIAPITRIFWNKLYKILLDEKLLDELKMGVDINSTAQNFQLIFSLPQFVTCLKEFWKKQLPDGLMQKQACFERIESLNLKVSSQLLIDISLHTEIIFLYWDYYIFKRERFSDLYQKLRLPDERTNAIILMKLEGASLQETGEHFGITRERVRQIVVKQVRNLPELFEDCFAQPYETFRLTKSEFSRLFPEITSESYEYIALRYKKGKQGLSHETLTEYNGYWKDRLEIFLQNELERKDKRTVSRTEMVYRVLVRNSDNPLSMEEFEQEYYRYIRHREYPEARLRINLRSVGNHLRNARGIVFNRDNKVRYCEADLQKLWKNIDFDAYKNLVISAELLFRDYTDLMDELDIRDGYELFYALKSSLALWKGSFEISFRRVPTIIVGNGSEERQALRLLQEISPVEHDDYLLAYEERFGIRHDSVLGNSTVMGAITPYYINGEYSMNVPAITAEDIPTFLQILDGKTIWFTEELERLFDSVCVHSPREAFNMSALRRIGYILRAGYAIKESYGNMTSYIDMEIFSKDVVDLSALDRRLKNLSAFGSALEKKRNSLEYIETAPKILVSIQKVKETYDLDQEDIRQIQQILIPYCKMPYFNAHSLWDEIKDIPLIQKLQGNEWMLSCIMRQQENVFAQHFAGNIVLSLDSNNLNLGKISLWFCSVYGKMSLNTFAAKFNDYFGFKIPNYKFAEKLKSANVWDDIVTDSMDEYMDSLIDFSEMSDDDLFSEEFI
jgi:alkylhydroperoxidase/carboxymuconolactone decarboxylase family protein YurZ